MVGGEGDLSLLLATPPALSGKQATEGMIIMGMDYDAAMAESQMGLTPRAQGAPASVRVLAEYTVDLSRDYALTFLWSRDWDGQEHVTLLASGHPFKRFDQSVWEKPLDATDGYFGTWLGEVPDDPQSDHSQTVAAVLAELGANECYYEAYVEAIGSGRGIQEAWDVMMEGGGSADVISALFTHSARLAGWEDSAV